jgi:hypothetical protein
MNVRAARAQLSPVLYGRRPGLLSLMVDRTPSAHLHDRFAYLAEAITGQADDVRI